MAEPSLSHFYFVKAEAGDCDVGAHKHIEKWFTDKSKAVKAYKKALKEVQDEIDWMSHLVESEPSLEWNGAHFYEASILEIPRSSRDTSQPTSEEIAKFIEDVRSESLKAENVIILCSSGIASEDGVSPRSEEELRNEIVEQIAEDSHTLCYMLDD